MRHLKDARKRELVAYFILPMPAYVKHIHAAFKDFVGVYKFHVVTSIHIWSNYYPHYLQPLIFLRSVLCLLVTLQQHH